MLALGRRYMAWGRRLDRSDPCSCLSWAGPKHELRGMCVFVCVCVYCAGGLYVIYDLGGRLLAAARGMRVSPPRLRSARRCKTGEPKVLQSASYFEYGPLSLEGETATTATKGTKRPRHCRRWIERHEASAS